MKQNSEKLKQEILELLLWKRNFLFWMSEFNNWHWYADVFAISKTMMAWEFEIKISKQDLMSEISSLNLIINKEQSIIKKKHYNKYLKHNYYISTHLNWKLYNKSYNDTVPNYFCFFVPKMLKDIAKKELIKTPYWLYVFDEDKRIWKQISCIKKPQKIHKEKVWNHKIFDFAKRLSSENLSFRKKYAK